MMICYIGYCVALGFNTRLEAWVQTFSWIPCKAVNEQESLVAYKAADGQAQQNANYEGTALSPTVDPYNSMGQQQQQQQGDQQQQGLPGGQNAQHPPGMAPRPDVYKAKELDPNQVGKTETLIGTGLVPTTT